MTGTASLFALWVGVIEVAIIAGALYLTRERTR